MQERRLLEIIDFGDLPVFAEATTYPCILSWQNTAPTGTFRAANVEELRPDDFVDYLPTITYDSLQEALKPEGWTLADVPTQRLLDKLQQTGTTLGDYVDGEIYYGIKTGLNEAFVIDAATREQLLAEDPRSAEVIKPFLAGRDIKRYVPPRAEKLLILFPKGWTREQWGDLDEATAFAKIQTDYPAIAHHLNPFAEKGRKRYDKGEYWWDLRACDYYEEFAREKIIIPAIVKEPSYSFDRKGIYSNDKTSIIPTDDLSLLALLNSKTVNFCATANFFNETRRVL